MEIRPNIRFRVPFITFFSRRNHRVRISNQNRSLPTNVRATPKFSIKFVRNINFQTCLRSSDISPTFLRVIRLTSGIFPRLYKYRVLVFSLRDYLCPDSTGFSFHFFSDQLLQCLLYHLAKYCYSGRRSRWRARIFYRRRIYSLEFFYLLSCVLYADQRGSDGDLGISVIFCIVGGNFKGGTKWGLI